MLLDHLFLFRGPFLLLHKFDGDFFYERDFSPSSRVFFITISFFRFPFILVPTLR